MDRIEIEELYNEEYGNWLEEFSSWNPEAED